MNKNLLKVVGLLCVLLLTCAAFAQETTAGIQGTIKDPQGAVVSGATVEVSSPALIGVKKLDTDSGGYYRFANLPPGSYTITVTKTGFRTLRQEGVRLAVGSLPSIDLKMEVGGVEQTIEVSSAAPIVDVTQSKVQTNVTAEVLAAVPKGRSFQSVIQFAPGARQEPLQAGYQIDGATNSENSYLVEGQETASIQTGAANTNVPMEFIQEVQVKSSGFEAEYGGALGGVVNVIQKRGSNAWHGSVFTYYVGDLFNAAPNRTLRKDPNSLVNNGRSTNPASPNYCGLFNECRLDQTAQYYQPKKDHYRTITPGFEAGGYLMKDRLWAFLSFVPEFSRTTRTVFMKNLTPTAGPAGVTPGNRNFYQNTETYYSLARVDYLLSQKIRVYGAWQYGYSRRSGAALPDADEVFGLSNNTAGNNPDDYNTGVGWVQPRVIYNTGADITITPSLVATARYGYFYNDYQDRGLPTGIRYFYRDTTYSYNTGIAPAPATLTSAFTGQTLGAAAPTLVNSTGWSNIGNNATTLYDQYGRKSFSGDLAWFKKGFLGTHNIKGGYALNNLSNNVNNLFNSADVYVGFGLPWFPSLTSPACTDANGDPIACPAAQRFDPGEHCADIIAENVAQYGASAASAGCRGDWGTVNLRDLGTTGKVSSYNHSLYIQDAWTIGSALTVNAGIRFDKEDLPSYTAGAPGISFGFGDKVAPRLGASYDVFHNGKLKIYGSFGYFYDIMKFEMPRGSFGGDWWHDCVYALDNPNFFTSIVPTRGGDGNHYCPKTGAANGNISGGRFIANEDFRAPSNDPRAAIDPVSGLPRSGVDPKLKPMKQHEMVIGADWALTPQLAFETRYSRKRLDRTIEDAGVLTPYGEQYYIVNPGFGDHAVSCTGCPNNPKAERRYDGIEFRITKRPSGSWFGTLSYTYSRLYGNYSGLTATDVSDGGAGRNSPNVDRAFDEPFMSFDANGKAIDGPLATDRPNTFKAYGYYRLKWWKMETLLGGSQLWYQGTPLSTYLSVWGAPVFVEGRGNFVDVHRDATNLGNWVQDGISKGKRTPSYSQTDFSLVQEFKVSKSNENMKLGFEANVTNLFNQHSVTYVNQNLIRTGSITGGAIAGPNYPVMLGTTGGYDWLGIANLQGQASLTSRVLNSTYGMPYGWQDGRSMRFKMKFVF